MEQQWREETNRICRHPKLHFTWPMTRADELSRVHPIAPKLCALVTLLFSNGCPLFGFRTSPITPPLALANRARAAWAVPAWRAPRAEACLRALRAEARLAAAAAEGGTCRCARFPRPACPPEFPIPAPIWPF